MVTHTYLFKFSHGDFWGCWVAGRRQTHFDVRFVADCLTFQVVYNPNVPHKKCRMEDLRNYEEIAIKQWF